jgi:hypothetical protein
MGGTLEENGCRSGLPRARASPTTRADESKVVARGARSNGASASNADDGHRGKEREQLSVFPFARQAHDSVERAVRALLLDSSRKCRELALRPLSME